MQTVFRSFFAVRVDGLVPRVPLRLAYVVALVLFVPLASCQRHITDQGKRQLRSAGELVNEKSYPSAEKELSGFLRDFSRTVQAGEAHYMIGLCRVYMGQIEQDTI